MKLVACVAVAIGLMVTACTSSAARAPEPSSAPASSSAPAPGDGRQTLTVDGTTRSFLLHHPASLPAGPAPLVLMLHGGSGSAAAAERSDGWDAEADAEHFVVAYPEGEDASWSVGGGCCGRPATQGVDDVAFLTAVVARIKQELPIDPARIYATGISAGGMMSYRLACETNFLAAIGPDSATLLGACSSPHPLSVIHIHGTADQRIPYDGNPGAGVNHIDGPPIPTLSATWQHTDGCDPPQTSTSGAVTREVASCPDGRGVELITIAGAGHQWPGAICNANCADGGADPPSRALSATRTIWAFFAAHPMAS